MFRVRLMRNETLNTCIGVWKQFCDMQWKNRSQDKSFLTLSWISILICLVLITLVVIPTKFYRGFDISITATDFLLCLLLLVMNQKTCMKHHLLCCLSDKTAGQFGSSGYCSQAKTWSFYSLSHSPQI